MKKGKPETIGGPSEVDAFLAGLDHPLVPTVRAVRAAILGVDPGIREGVE